MKGIQQDLYNSQVLVQKIHDLPGKAFIIQYITFTPKKSFIKRENCWKNQLNQSWNIVKKTHANYRLKYL